MYRRRGNRPEGRRRRSCGRRPNPRPNPSEEVPMRKKIEAGVIGFLASWLACAPAAAWSHANSYGGHSSGNGAGDWSHENAYGGSTSHDYGEGTEHTNAYGGSTAHSYYGGTEHTNVDGGKTYG